MVLFLVYSNRLEDLTDLQMRCIVLLVHQFCWNRIHWPHFKSGLNPFNLLKRFGTTSIFKFNELACQTFERKRKMELYPTWGPDKMIFFSALNAFAIKLLWATAVHRGVCMFTTKIKLLFCCYNTRHTQRPQNFRPFYGFLKLIITTLCCSIQ